uniref:BAALC binder of MAP3K1 and KLF4 b n=1 Tax=Oryzias melastigma TaxID=30732 RepID=A0A3B3DKX8_ORYME
MGRGASRTDALEPDCLESWTKETESTWMTSTEINIPLSSIHSIPHVVYPEEGGPLGSESCFQCFVH